MGIKHLWSILTPFVERKPLYELEGKTVAIDLSCWICEAQNVTDYHIQPKMNLYFRTCFLLLMQVSPIFVLEGKAPKLKYDTMAARNAIQFKGAKPRSGSSEPKSKDRSRFISVLNRCEEMLRYMGIVCVKGNGEAESMCAYLNMRGIVDGCVTQDSDCFAYGGKVIYRNFSISQQGAHSGAGAIDVYDIAKIYRSIEFGVFGIGKEAAMKLFEHITDDEILDRLRSWQTNGDFYRNLSEEFTNKNICTLCGHRGTRQSHIKYGCENCATSNGCDSSKYEKKRMEIKNETSIREKAIKDEHFPNEELISEFLQSKESITKSSFEWQQPDICSFVAFAVKHLQWEHIYAFEKFLPILTRWHLSVRTATSLVPRCIKKVRHLKGVPGYEVIWEHSGLQQDLLPSDMLEGVDLEKLWSTVEPQTLVSEAYPALVEKFEQSKIKPKKTRKIRKLPKTIDSYFAKKKRNDSFNLNLSKFGDESDLDLSDLIENVVSHNVDYVNVLSESLDESNFFTNTFTEGDLFEKSMITYSDSSSEDDYVPLIERIKCKK
ncbi:hypothetical protein RI129_012337 [Pyrocoelia pectoralis]|uniref:Flap endonuclease GEN n=1 Tax=Pyrocoelia pectoralis TaxID=417401 RepID=A0AAN7ZBZ7_9COLE